MNALHKYLSHIGSKGTRVNERDNTIHDYFDCMVDRYLFDFKLCQPPAWKQYDTRQDASYFGVWINIKERLTLTYCEGDISLVSCADDDHLRAELDSMAEFYGPTPPSMWSVDTDTGEATAYVDERPSV